MKSYCKKAIYAIKNFYQRIKKYCIDKSYRLFNRSIYLDSRGLKDKHSLSELKKYRGLKFYLVDITAYKFKKNIREIPPSSYQRVQIFLCGTFADHLLNRDLMKEKNWLLLKEFIFQQLLDSNVEKESHAVIARYQVLNDYRESIQRILPKAKFYLVSQHEEINKSFKYQQFVTHHSGKFSMLMLVVLSGLLWQQFYRAEKSIIAQRKMATWLKTQSPYLLNQCEMNNQVFQHLSRVQKNQARIFRSLFYQQHYQGGINRYLTPCVFKPFLSKLISQVLQAKQEGTRILKSKKKALSIRLYIEMISTLSQGIQDKHLVNFLLKQDTNLPNNLDLSAFFFRYIESLRFAKTFERLSSQLRALKEALDRRYQAEFLYQIIKVSASAQQKRLGDLRWKALRYQLPNYLFTARGFKREFQPVALDKGLAGEVKQQLLKLYVTDYVNAWKLFLKSFHLQNIQNLNEANLVLAHLEKDLKTAAKVKVKLLALSGINRLADSKLFLRNSKIKLYELQEKLNQLDIRFHDKKALVMSLKSFFQKQTASSIESASTTEVKTLLSGCQHQSMLCAIKKRIEKHHSQVLGSTHHFSKQLVAPFWQYLLSLEEKRLSRVWAIFLEKRAVKLAMNQFPINALAKDEMSMSQFQNLWLGGGEKNLKTIIQKQINPLLDKDSVHKRLAKKWLGYGVSFSPASLIKLQLLEYVFSHNGKLDISLYPLPNNRLKLVDWKIAKKHIRYRNGPQHWQKLQLDLLGDVDEVSLKYIDVQNNIFYHSYHGAWAVWRLLSETAVSNSMFHAPLEISVVIKHHHRQQQASWRLKSADIPILKALLSYESLLPLTL